MKFRKSRSDDAQARQRRSTIKENSSKSQSVAYNNRRFEEEPNIGRNIERNDRKPSALRSQHFWLQRFGLIILLLAVVVSGINILKLSTTAEILPVTNNSSDTLIFDKSGYQAAADQLLRSSLWDRNKITIDTGQLSHHLLNKFPDLSIVNVTIPLLSHNPIIYIEPTQPAVMIKSATSGDSFVLNESGKVILKNTPNPIVVGQTALPVITDQSGLRLALGVQVLPAGTVNFVQTVSAQLTAKSYSVTTMTLPAASSELDVALTGKPYVIKFNLENNDARQQVGTFLATIGELQSQNITPAKYVDVRVDGRAYYQ